MPCSFQKVCAQKESNCRTKTEEGEGKRTSVGVCVHVCKRTCACVLLLESSLVIYSAGRKDWERDREVRGSETACVMCMCVCTGGNDGQSELCSTLLKRDGALL